MPTPFYHLSLAKAIVEHPGISDLSLSSIIEYFPAFLLGHTAPDVQTVSGQSRESTHFYNLPIQVEDVVPWTAIFISHPSLAGNQINDPEQVVFIAGYLCHLLADWFWAGQIFEPYFGPSAVWKTFRERLYLHNVMRAYFDFQVLATFDGEVRSGLAAVKPKTWLPFVKVEYLKTWRNFLAGQLQPGAPIQTVEVFAARQGISVEHYYQLLKSEDEMQQQVFDHFPRAHLENYWRFVMEKSIHLLNKYLTQVGGVSNASS